MAVSTDLLQLLDMLNTWILCRWETRMRMQLRDDHF